MSLQETIFIVDDNTANLSFLSNLLRDAGYKVFVARSGESALEKIPKVLPDLILLDVMMKEMDGFTVCKILKERPDTEEIPVLFITALTDVQSKVNAFAHGAVDYVSKPVQQDELLARVKTHLHLRQMTQQLQTQNHQLAQLNHDKDKFISILAHDLTGPFAPIISFSQLLSQSADHFTYQEICEFSTSIHNAAHSVHDLLQSLLQWSRLGNGRLSFRPAPLNLFASVEAVLTLYKETAKKKNLKLDCQVPSHLRICADEQMLHTILRNLIHNSIKFTEKGRIIIKAKSEPDHTLIQVTDTGQGIPLEKQSHLFELASHQKRPYKNKQSGAGLGLLICQGMVAQHQGKIWVESQPSLGTTIFFTLPHHS